MIPITLSFTKGFRYHLYCRMQTKRCRGSFNLALPPQAGPLQAPMLVDEKQNKVSRQHAGVQGQHQLEGLALPGPNPTRFPNHDNLGPELAANVHI